MQRFHQFVFAGSLVALSWLAMMAVHELGHVIGAVVSGGSVVRVVLHPLTISRTDVSPNPNPGTVVWFGPAIGSFLPLAVSALVPRRYVSLRNIAQFFAGFCLIANGTYIAFGSFYRVGDSGEMLYTGSTFWLLLAFGAVTIPFGIFLWHRLGEISQFINNPSLITAKMAYAVLVTLIALVVAAFTFSAR